MPVTVRSPLNLRVRLTTSLREYDEWSFETQVPSTMNIGDLRRFLATEPEAPRIPPSTEIQCPNFGGNGKSAKLIDTDKVKPNMVLHQFRPARVSESARQNDSVKMIDLDQPGLDLMRVTLTTTQEGFESWSMHVNVLSTTTVKALRLLLRRPPHLLPINQEHKLLCRLDDVGNADKSLKGMLCTLKAEERVVPHVIIRNFDPGTAAGISNVAEAQQGDIGQQMQKFWEFHDRMAPRDRRAVSWPTAVNIAGFFFQSTGHARPRICTEEKPNVYWIVEATEQVEGVILVEKDAFTVLAGFPPRHTECYIMGCGLEALEKEIIFENGIRVRLKKISYDDKDAILSARKPDLIMLYHAEFTSTLGTERQHINVPSHVLEAGKGARVAVSLRFKLWDGSLKVLSNTLGDDLAFPPLRNRFSSLSGDTNAEYDDNGWLVGLKSVDALDKFLKLDLRPPFPEARDPEKKMFAIFWGIVDLKYNTSLSIFERVKVLETGDGRASKFSHHGAEIPRRFRARHVLSETSGSGRHTVVSNNKKLTHDEFVSHGYDYLVPEQLCLPRVYDLALAKRIIDGLGCSETDILVLKLCNRARAAGIIPVPVGELDEVLEELLDIPDDMEAWFERKMAQFDSQTLGVKWGVFEEQYRHWWSNECPFFVVERCYQSMPMPSEVDDDLYDGTLRVAFALRRRASQNALKRDHTNGDNPSPEQRAREELEIEWLGGYWKLPKEGVTSPLFRDRIISAAKSKGTQAVSPAHLHEIYAALGRSIQILFSAGDPSITSLSKAYADDPIMAAYFTARLAVTVRDLTRGPQALELATSLLNKAEDGFPKRLVESYIHRGYGVFEAQRPPGCWKEALDRFSLSLARFPSNATSWYLKGMALLELGRPQESIEPMQRALMLDLDFKAPYVNLGIAFLRLCEYDAAIQISEAVLLRHPDSPQCNYHIGLSCFAKTQDLEMRFEQLSQEEIANYEDLRTRALEQMMLARESEEAQRLELRFPPVSPWLEEDGEVMSVLRLERSMTAPKRASTARHWCRVKFPHNVGWRFYGWRT